MTDEQRNVAERLRPSFYTAFGVYWATFALYGLHAGLAGALAIQEQAPDVFAVLFGYAICVCGVLAGIGVALSHRYRKPWVEVVGICIAVGLMAGYSVALVTRAIDHHSWAASSGAWLPIIVSIFPMMRIAWIANGDELFKRKHVQHEEAPGIGEGI